MQVFKVDVKVFNGWRGFEVGVKCKVDVKVFDGCRGFEVGVKCLVFFCPWIQRTQIAALVLDGAHFLGGRRGFTWVQRFRWVHYFF